MQGLKLNHVSKMGPWSPVVSPHKGPVGQSVGHLREGQTAVWLLSQRRLWTLDLCGNPFKVTVNVTM